MSVLDVELFFGDDGAIRSIYSDALPDLIEELGPARTRRASAVEPASADGWTADLSASSGPVLGPFRLRSEALAAEVEWLRSHDLGRPPRGTKCCTCKGRSTCRGAANLGTLWRCVETGERGAGGRRVPALACEGGRP